MAAFSPVSLRLEPGTSVSVKSELVASPTLLENRYVRVELNADGDITRIFVTDAARRRARCPE